MESQSCININEMVMALKSDGLCLGSKGTAVCVALTCAVA